MLAPPGAGFQAALGAIDVARTDIAAIAVGLAAQALDTALAYTRDRTIFGGTVLDLQGIQFALADVETDIVAGRLLYERAAALLGTPEGAVAAAHAKRLNPDMALQAAIECAEALGSYGWLKSSSDLPRRVRPGADAADGRRHARDPARRHRPRSDAARPRPLGPAGTIQVAVESRRATAAASSTRPPNSR